jgi:hypothetical protein
MALFDNLMVISHGKTVYFGPNIEVVEYFASIGYKCPQYENPADYISMNQSLSLSYAHTLIVYYPKTLKGVLYFIFLSLFAVETIIIGKDEDVKREELTSSQSKALPPPGPGHV